MVSIDFRDKELQKFLKRVAYCAEFGRKNQREMLKINRKISKTYWMKARRNIRDAKEVFKVWKNGNIYREVTPGTLRRSMGAWRSGRRNNVILAGPRAFSKAPNINADGWYGTIVEAGHVGTSASKNTRNKGVFQKTLKETTETMRIQQINEYRKEFKQYTR